MLSSTSTALLLGLKDAQNDPAWTEFCARYRPFIVSFACRLGLSEQDAQDAAQDALLAFAEAYRDGKYDRAAGRLHSWLFGIAQRKVHDIQRRRGKELVLIDPEDGTRLMNRVVDDHRISEVWDAEWCRAVVKECLDEVRKQVEPDTMQAFELITLRQKPADEVASQLGMTHNAVLKANRRVLSRMRELQQHLETHW